MTAALTTAALLLAVLSAAPSAAEQWRILAVRVDFPLEEIDEPSTSGNGAFDLRSASEALPDYVFPYDLPPHNRTYFQRHLQALARYYDTVSEGQVEIDYEVFPSAESGAYALPQSALWYGNGRSPEEIADKWVQLVRDAVAAAEGDPAGPDFSLFNSFLFIHAGLGHETGQLNDIRSVFLAETDLEVHTAERPIAADGIDITSAWILPEAVNDQGRAGLNGLTAKFFGHQLGLPGLSNFADGLPATGGWSLMDVGPNRLGFVLQGAQLRTVFGFVPPHPIAWSKARLGWIEPLIVHRDTTVTLVATDRTAAAEWRKAVQVPISSSEYFLIENRQRRGRTALPEGVEPPFQGIDITWIEPEQIEFSGTGEDEASLGPDSGVWLGVGEYDAFIPGSGILIWHVDDAVIAAEESSGAVNNDRVRQGIVLEEADGERDIGNAFFERQDVTEGEGSDPFFAGTAPDGGVSNTVFGPDTTPSTTTNSGLSTGVSIEVLSELGDTMTVRIEFGNAHPGWPLAMASGERLQGADLDGDDAIELIAQSPSGVTVLTNSGQTRAETEGVFLAAAPAQSQGPGAVFVASGDLVSAWQPTAEAAIKWTTTVETGPDAALLAPQLHGFSETPVLAIASVSGVAVLDAESGEQLQRTSTPPLSALALQTTAGEWHLLGTSAETAVAVSAGGTTTLWQSTAGALMPLVTGDLDGDGDGEIVAVSQDGLITALAADGQVSWQSALVQPVVGSPVLGDVDGDGYLEIVVATQQGIVALRATGAILANFPIEFPSHQELQATTSGPILADLDGDGRQEIVAAMESGALIGIDDDGTQLPGFPVRTAAGMRAAPLAADVDGDGAIELAALAGDFIHLWDPARMAPTFAVSGNVSWGQAGFTAAGTHAQSAAVEVVAVTSALLPPESAYCYPNPVAGSERAHMRFYLSRAATLQLEVFDAIGERVDERRWTAQSLAVANENEIAWSTNGYDSGLYLCRLEATGADGSKDHVIVRLAVTR